MKSLIWITTFIALTTVMTSCSLYFKQDAPNPTDQTKNVKQTRTHINPQSRPNTTYSSSKPKWVAKRPPSRKERFSGVLNSHNRIRTKHKLPPLRWSSKLAKYSQEWANRLGRGKKCQMYHRSHSPYGENLYRSTAIVWTDGRREINPVTIKQVVKAWTDEEQWYDYSRNRCQAGQQCGHYTQVVWRKTKEVGCAMQVCGDKSQIWVCSYNPPGNYVGVRPY